MGRWFSVIPGPAAWAAPGKLLEMMAGTTAVGAPQVFAGDAADSLVLEENDTISTGAMSQGSGPLSVEQVRITRRTRWGTECYPTPAFVIQ